MEKKINKNIKTVSANKLPRIFKKHYDSKSFENKLLKKLYIKTDCDFVEKLFIEKKDKKNRKIITFNETLKISISDLKKYKLLSKQIKQQKGGIKIIPLISVIIFITTITLCIIFFKNIIIEKALIFALQDIFEAKTDIEKVDFQIFNASLEINGLEQANKDSPMKNLFEIDKIRTDFYLSDLLKGKFHAKTISVEGVAIDTNRIKSGKLPIKIAKTKEKKQNKENIISQKNNFSQNAENKLKGMFENYNPEKIIGNLQDELKSPTVASQITSDVQTKIEKWKNVPQEIQSEVNAFSENISTLTKTDFSKINDLAKLKTTLEQINKSIEQSKNLKKTLEKTTTDLSNDSKSINDYSKQIQNAIKADNILVESKIAEMKSLFSSEGLNDVMNNAIQSILYDICGKYYPYVNKGLDMALSIKNSSSNSKTQKDVKAEKKSFINKTKERLPGRNIFFKEDTVPTLYIENITASGYEYKTNNLLFKGIANFISNDQDICKKPSNLQANFNINGNPNNVSATIDARSTSSSPLLIASYMGSGFSISTNTNVFELNSKSSINAKLSANKTGNALLNGSIDMNIIEITGMQFEPEKVCNIYNEALKNLKKLSIDFTIKINSDKTLSISINNPTKTAKQISEPISIALTGELNSIANDAKNNITKILSEKTGVATNQIQQFTNIQSNINNSKNKVDNLQNQLEQKKKQINEQISNAAKSTTSDVANKLIKILF